MIAALGTSSAILSRPPNSPELSPPEFPRAFLRSHPPANRADAVFDHMLDASEAAPLELTPDPLNAVGDCPDVSRD